jgi:alkanesulfonate monooxygenase SsuD/methylene tetrahydromethanopterin reductase-like flavin-dependent oxidoreductase (luciferase family)
MGRQWVTAPWVKRHQHRVGFGLHVFPAHTSGDRARELLAAGRLAEALGFDAFFVGDHPAWQLDPWLHLAALAASTDRIRLGLNVACVHYRHPVLTARLAADLDNLSGGRVVVGLGCGWDPGGYASLGLPFPPTRERLAAVEEAVTIIRGVWGETPFSFDGRYFRTADTHIAPRPVQQPRVPLMIAGPGERVTLRQVAQYADACNLFEIDIFGSGALTTEDVRRKLETLRRHCAALGRPYESVLHTYVTGWMILAEDRRRLQAKLERYFPGGIERHYSPQWRKFVFGGTPDDAVAYCRGLVEAGMQYLMFNTQDATDEETIRLLAEGVAPAVAGMAAATRSHQS